MTIRNHQLMQGLYEGRPAEKLASAAALHAELAPYLQDLPQLTGELGQLRLDCVALARQMTGMDLGRLCGRCAARPDGGCCSAFMADNTDALQILINLLLGVSVLMQPDNGQHCCFLGPRGCLFAVKPIFCLNYNCTHILTGAAPADLSILYQRAAAVLSRQTRIEDLLLAMARDQTISVP
ncbi:MAG: hypothetical protein FWD79_01250 [Desulfobulbus sp.]|nr:hypothetical protein [Desulfobulbus sp.]